MNRNSKKLKVDVVATNSVNKQDRPGGDLPDDSDGDAKQQNEVLGAQRLNSDDVRSI